MNHLKQLTLVLTISAVLSTSALAANAPTKSFTAPNDLKITVKAISPVAQAADLQIICIFKHSSDDKYIEAMQEINDKQRGFLSTLRERGEFVGELGETFLYTPPAGSIAPKRVLLIGVGDTQGISIERLRLAGRIAVREAVRLQAKNVSFAPTLRDQGTNVIEVGEGDAAVAEQVLLAYDTEKKLQAQNLAPQFSIDEWVMEAGTKYFDSAVAKVGAVIGKADSAIKARNTSPYVAASTAKTTHQ